MISTAEKQFRAKYPHTRIVTERSMGAIIRCTVYAGDYLCSEGFTRAIAFQKALEWEQAQLITPDPEEISNEAENEAPAAAIDGKNESIALNVREATGQQFVAIRTAIMRGAEHIATTQSHNMAKRIANALNAYRPNAKGY